MTTNRIISVTQIDEAINVLQRIKHDALNLESDMRTDDSISNFEEAFETLMIEVLPDDLPLDVLDAARALIVLCID